MSGVLVVGLASGRTLHPASLEVAAAGRALAGTLGVPVFGAVIGEPDETAAARLAAAGLAEVFIADCAAPAPLVAEIQVAHLEFIVERCGASVVLAPHTLDTAEWLPLLAARLDAAVASDAARLTVEDGRILVTKPICGGAVNAEYVLNRAVGIVTIAAGAYSPAAPAPACPVTTVTVPPLTSGAAVLEEVADASAGGPALKQARIVVAGGLGVGSRDQWTLIREAAEALGAGVGATRAVVESGWVPSSHQVGYSGVKIAPDLYIAVGISGAVHHLAGISKATAVVAINVDAAAEIVKVARFVVVGDAQAVLPAFTARVREIRGGMD